MATDVVAAVIVAFAYAVMGCKVVCKHQNCPKILVRVAGVSLIESTFSMKGSEFWAVVAQGVVAKNCYRCP